jgi:hypothetical protein
MSAKDLFPENLTPAEAKAGFTVTEIANPDGHYAFALPTTKAVIFPVDASHRIIKMRDPGGGISYKMQQFGKFNFERPETDPAWSPCGDGFSLDPQDAVHNAARDVAAGAAGFKPMPAPEQTPDAAVIDPFLVDMHVDFKAGVEGKDGDTKLDVYFYRQVGGAIVEVAKSMDISQQKFEKNHTYSFDIHLTGGMARSQLLGSFSNVAIRPVGNDTFEFTYWITLTFSDGSKMQQGWVDVLDENVKTKSFIITAQAT